MESLFLTYQASIEEEKTTREAIKDEVKGINLIMRVIQGSLSQIHTNHKNAPSLCNNVKEHYTTLKERLQSLQKLVPAESYYRYIPLWRSEIQQIVFAMTLVHWFENGSLLSLEDIEVILELPGKSKGPAAWAVELEDYLLGVCMLPNELSRLSMNAVISEDYDLPKRIKNFVNELYAGFQLLNFKNDVLRRKFDSIKYDMKKIEEIEYDINIRNLRTQ